MLTHARLLELLHYDPLTGHFTWRVKRSQNVLAGDRGGHLHVKGYVRIGVAGGSYWAHRLAWLYMTGEWPVGQVDHIDGNRTNNAFANLRDVPQTINMQNQRVGRADSTHPLLGVGKPRWGGFRARIKVNGREQWLGTFSTPEAAHEAYVAAKRQFHPGCTL